MNTVQCGNGRSAVGVNFSSLRLTVDAGRQGQADRTSGVTVTATELLEDEADINLNSHVL